MPTEVILPRVDMDMTEGRISRWYVEDGAIVAKGQPIFEIETDKAAMEVEAPASGVIRDLSATLDAILPVGSVVAWIDATGEGAAAAAPAGTGASRRATPLARRLARENLVDLAAVAGSGPKGRVQAADIAIASLRAPSEAPAAPAAQSASARISSVKLHRQWLRQGEGTPLVMLHGFGADLNAWRLLLATVQPECPVLGIDLPGHGGSADRRNASFDEMVADIADTLAAEGLGAMHLAGHSLGAAAAAALAGREGIEARSLFLVAPAGLGPDINGAFLAGFIRARGKASLTPWIGELVRDPSALGPSFVEATLRQRSGERSAEGLEHVAATVFPDGTQAFSVRSAFSRLAMPVKIVFGAEDRIIPARHALGLPGRIAIHLFPGLGHMPHFEARDDVARLLKELMRSA
ncbi:MAG: acetoin dehydrogenase dihydrolipoyllysine-residue acetyltransferase subunit [Hyphomicrobiales bacterium]